MTEHGKLYVAEQAWTCCPLDVASRLLEVDSAAWLLPFLRLAGGDGEQAGARVLPAPAHAAAPPLPGAAGGPGPARTLLEEVELGEHAERGDGGTLRRSLLWRTAGFTVLFRRLEGHLSVAPRWDGAVLAIEGTFDRPPALDAMPNGPLAGRRAAEGAARSLLGHLRAALEDPALEQMLA